MIFITGQHYSLIVMKFDFHWLTNQAKELMVKVKAYIITVTSDSKTRITVLSCVNAAGYAIPPLVQCMHCHLVVVRWMVKYSMNGLSTTFLNVLHLADFALSLDGHSSHCYPTLYDLFVVLLERSDDE